MNITNTKAFVGRQWFISTMLLLSVTSGLQASNEVTVHHDAVALAKAAFEQEMDAIENAAMGVQGDAASIIPPSPAPSIHSRPNGCVKERRNGSRIVVPFNYERKDTISSTVRQCYSKYRYQHFTCRSNSQWEFTRFSNEKVTTNKTCFGEA